MQVGIVRIALFIFLMLSGTAYAGIGACHDGAGKITALEYDARQAAFTGENCSYYKDADYERVFAKIGHLQGSQRYVKWAGGEPAEMVPFEKVAVDEALAAEMQAQVVSSSRAGAKDSVDQLSAEGVRLRAALLVTLDRFNAVTAAYDAIISCNVNNSTAGNIRACINAIQPVGQATALQMKNAIKNTINAGSAD